ncbi:MAG: esterase-like activity of phytase family protein [Saprospiraceae bacterium]|nr:esterase-like activity of phytase family protein [Saprospiraceae bacterium]
MVRRLLLLILCLLLSRMYVKAQNELTLNRLSHFETGLEGAAETVAFDPESKRGFFTSSVSNSFSIIDLTDPMNPVLIKEVSLDAIGAGPNSIDVYEGLVAVAVQNTDKTMNGRVGFFSVEGELITSVQVGALPDMLTFTPDGQKVLVANEGEPNDDYSVDPEGSISIIDVATKQVTNLGFTAFNSKRAYLANKGIRIFGNNGMSTVAQDMEPEYITVTPDSKTAYVNCQESNSVVVVDLTTSAIKDILPLGYKNHALGSPKVELFNINELIADWPELGSPVYDGGQDAVKLGGFSGLFFDEKASTADDYIFYAVPDRGPNAEAISAATVSPKPAGDLRPYKLPNYQGEIVKFSFQPENGAVSLVQRIPLTRQDGVTPISGKGNIPGFDEVPVTYADTATAFKNIDYTDANGEQYHELPYDALGGDFEGILIDKEGNFWLCDENRPSVYKVDSTGKLIARYVPIGTSSLGSTPVEAGTYGEENIPEVYSKRRANRGFEAIAYDEEKNIVYAFIQSPIENPGSSVRNKTDVIRILGLDANSGQPVAEYVYLLERNKEAGIAASRVDKIGDAVYIGNEKFLVLERDSEGPENPYGKKYVFEIDLTGATNILGLPISNNDGTVDSMSGKSLEEHSADELINAGVQAVYKTLVTNLPSIGYQSSDKSEGIALLPENKIAVLNDNDFGIAGAGITDNSVLGIISFEDNYSFDPSDRDDKTELTSNPVYGMLLPDAIASFQKDGQTFIVTANEGDSRDYDGYSEEVRVRDLTLDTTAFPNASALRANSRLGRLKTTTSMGDIDGDGDFDRIYTFGGRSFSIFDQYGNLVYDSGNDFAKRTLEIEPDLFNEDEGTKDGRSDDKGVEPEAVAVGTIGDYTYAFIGFERQSAIVVYDITDPFNPKFITYYSNRSYPSSGTIGDIGPEIIKFVPADKSPNGNDLIIVGYEVSGSMAIIQVGEDIVDISEETKDVQFNVYPNPVVEGQKIFFDKEISGKVYNSNGVLITTIQQATSLDVSGLTSGVYVIKSALGTQRFLKL